MSRSVLQRLPVLCTLFGFILGLLLSFQAGYAISQIILRALFLGFFGLISSIVLIFLWQWALSKAEESAGEDGEEDGLSGEEPVMEGEEEDEAENKGEDEDVDEQNIWQPPEFKTDDKN